MTVPGSRYSGWHWDEDNTRLSCFIRGTEVLRVDDTTADLQLLVNGISGLSATNLSLNDNSLLKFGTSNDIVMLNRSSTLNANTTLTDVIVGSPVTGEIPANSLIISNITADGDIVLAAQTGGNSIEYLRVDASARELVINEASNNIDFRVESDSNANCLFVDAALNRVGILNATPAVELDVTGAITASGIISADEWQTTGGGTTTQTTNKGTAFTLSTTTGVVTMSNASLAAGVEVVSVWTNTTLNATSTVIVNHAASGAGNAEDYLITVGEISSGAAEITVSNISSGSLSDAIQFNFVVIGGANS